VIALATLLVLTLVAAPPAGDVALLPADGAAASCTRSGATETYNGADLYGLIDGGAEAFLELGFERATVQRYACAGREITLELYRMSDATAALGIYLAKCGRETPDSSLPARNTIGRLQLQVVKGTFYVTVTGDAAGDGMRPALLALAGAAIGAVAAEGGDPLAALPADGLVAGSERLIRGPFALQAIVTLGEGDILQLQENGVTALAGEYREAGGARFSRVLADYPTAATAERAFAAVRDGLDPYLTVVERAATRLVLRDHAGRFGVVSRSGARIELLVNLPAPP